MKLISLRMEARGTNGWSSPDLIFGTRTTTLFAANGSGKTPLIQAMIFCMGFPITFRDDLNGKCEAAVLTVEISGELLELRRTLSKEFNIEVKSQSGGVRQFLSEGDFSAALFQSLRLHSPVLVGSDRKASSAYVSTILPLFYLDQDSGYSDFYRPARSFLADQFVEMIRICFDLSPKNSYEKKSELLKAKELLESYDRRIVTQQKNIVDLAARVDDREETRVALEERLGEIQAQLLGLRETVSLKGGANAALDEIKQEQERLIFQLRREVSDLKQRLDGISSIRQEIQIEIETLALNEESRRVFVSFEEICRNPNCGLFVGSSESYAKNLVYLKDQIKDLERNGDHARIRLEEMTETLSSREQEYRTLLEKIDNSSNDSGVGNLVVAIQALTTEVYVLEQKRTSISLLRTERDKFLKLSNERNRIQDQIANLTTGGRSDLEFNKLRLRLQALVVKWLDVLETQNVYRDVEIDLEFKFKFGNEPSSAIKGSTKTRVVLAVHAAIFELYLDNPKNPFRFLLLDTPKQHEMHTQDIAQYLTELTALCGTKNGQLIFSSTEYRHPIEEQDREWMPTFTGPKKKMFLGPI